MTALQESIDLVRTAAQAADRLKATDPVAYDVSDRLGITDAMLIVSANNERQVLAIAEEIEKDLYLNHNHLEPRSREGVAEGQWILIDYGDIIVNVMHDDSRLYYNLERLWRDCERIALDLTANGPDDTTDSVADAADSSEE
ncbi:ribosome silencing factor [Bifidobacterium gallicum]|uniref:Ribosomal silencing factor RsfS n=1 Tax=Bifidobacterium gallicum DSM 20093 = LMG 11596 TaxID=561180 RepID=D1NTV4_9BIFI|nr:ribosome silencing factor [Bifidobacterium gallicum]EFA23158.1 iojap-like protein [Bifidobacterium gallicum DSM 20093 = LMG 11596]KFI58828.1 ribosome-associated protein IOJAP [Bifidobacterium gallicum DSM 20093 = LMG 11596]